MLEIGQLSREHVCFNLGTAIYHKEVEAENACRFRHAHPEISEILRSVVLAE
jgi:hypothetical protein